MNVRLRYFLQSQRMNTVAPLLSPSEQPRPFIQPRKISSACGHLGPFLAAQAPGQHSCLTSELKHMGWASRFSPSSSAAIKMGVIGGTRGKPAPRDTAWAG